MGLLQALDRALHRALDCGVSTSQETWEALIAEPNVSNSIVKLLSDTLIIEPLAHWQEALRSRFLPGIPKRTCLVDPEWWEVTRHAFVDGGTSVDYIDSAAWHLILDAMLNLLGFYDPQDELRQKAAEEVPEFEQRSQEIKALFSEIAALTRDHDAAPLRIAHCIRDLAYGDESRTDDLVAMVHSDEPAYKEIFTRCYWLPTPEEAAQEAEQS
jgi:hypothetical protein